MAVSVGDLTRSSATAGSNTGSWWLTKTIIASPGRNASSFASLENDSSENGSRRIKMADTSWTPSMVEERFVEAADVMRRLPGVRVPGHFNTWPKVIYDFADLV